jgi:hypothetical protein
MDQKIKRKYFSAVRRMRHASDQTGRTYHYLSLIITPAGTGKYCKRQRAIGVSYCVDHASWAVASMVHPMFLMVTDDSSLWRLAVA